MTRDEVLEMARQCKALTGYEGEPDYLIDFASLVAAAEMERCANLVLDDEYACTFQSMGKYRTEIAKSLRMPANQFGVSSLQGWAG